MYEVEQKYPLADVAAVEAALARLGATWHATVEQVDRYFNHPCRDFAATDEALRLRRTDQALAITWKGPRLDATAKTRRELELPLADRRDQPLGSQPQSLCAGPSRWRPRRDRRAHPHRTAAD